MSTKTLTISQTKKRAISDPEIRNNLKSLVTSIDKSWVQICIYLHKAYIEKMFTKWGYEKFEDYVLKELGMRYRTAMIHQQIGETIDFHNLSEQKIGEIGWTKFKHLTYLITDDTTEEQLNQLFEDVKGMTVEQVKDYVWKTRTAKKGSKAVKKQAVKFTLIPEQIEVWDTVRREIFEMSGIEDPSRQFEFLCINFGMHHTPVDPEVVLESMSPEVEPPAFTRKKRADQQFSVERHERK